MATVDRRISALEGELASTKAKLADVRVKSEANSKVAGRSLTAIREELQAARKVADQAVGEAKASADARVERLAGELANRLNTEQQHRQELQHQLKTEISKVTDAASQANQKIGEVNTEVVAVKSELAADRSRLEHTVADLHRVKGDLGVQSGLIATNARELAALKAIGERNYYDIDLPMKQSKAVAGVTLVLKKADPKKLRFTLEVTASDKKVEKRDRVLNEPVQFLVSRNKGPYQVQVDDLYELVVNEVTKNQIKGYLATPKGPIPAAANVAAR